MKKKAVIGTVILIGAVAVGVGLTAARKDKSAELHFKLEAFSRGDIESTVTATGAVKALTLVEVGSQVSGMISRMAVDFNSPVKAGQVLAEIDRQPSQAKVSQSNANYLGALAGLEKAKITLANLKAKYERSTSLAAANLVSSEELEAAEAGYLSSKTDLVNAESSVDRARSALESSRLDLGYCVIRSPIDGIVISRNMEAGQTVQSNYQAVKMFEIASDLRKMKIECDIDEADVGKIAEGQLTRFTVDAFPERQFHGTVQQLRYSPTTTSNVVTYTAIIDADNPELLLRPGMTATATIVTGEAKAALLAPAAALRFTPKLPEGEAAKLAKAARDAEEKSGGAGRRQVVIWHLDDKGKLRATAVGAGISNAAYVEIVAGGFKEGGKVITGYETALQAAARAQQGPPPGATLMGAPPPPPPPPGGGGGPPPR